MVLVIGLFQTTIDIAVVADKDVYYFIGAGASARLCAGVLMGAQRKPARPHGELAEPDVALLSPVCRERSHCAAAVITAGGANCRARETAPPNLLAVALALAACPARWLFYCTTVHTPWFFIHGIFYIDRE